MLLAGAKRFRLRGKQTPLASMRQAVGPNPNPCVEKATAASGSGGRIAGLRDLCERSQINAQHRAAWFPGSL